MEPLPPIAEAAPRYRQMRLLTVGNPLAARLGADFFRSIPRQPGVYFFYDASDRLLYIGQSNDLRARVGSYRHVTPEQNVKRTLRLVHRIARVELQLCETAEQAIALEASLLLERRPPFNRAGVWKGPPWHFVVGVQEGHLHVRLTRQVSDQAEGIGPLSSSFRYVHASLMRWTFRLLNPTATLAGYPIGLLAPTIPLSLRWRLPEGDAEEIATLLASYASGIETDLLTRLEALPQPVSALEQQFWLEELERLRRAFRKMKAAAPSQAWVAAAPLPLFPEVG